MNRTDIRAANHSTKMGTIPEQIDIPQLALIETQEKSANVVVSV